MDRDRARWLPARSRLPIPLVRRDRQFACQNRRIAAGGGAAPLPVFAMAALLAGCGYFAADLAGIGSSWVFVPMIAGLALYLLERAEVPINGATALAVVLIAGLWLIRDLSGINALFAALLLAGGLVVSIACLARRDHRSGFYPLLVVMLPVLVGAAARLD